MSTARRITLDGTQITSHEKAKNYAVVAYHQFPHLGERRIVLGSQLSLTTAEKLKNCAGIKDIVGRVIIVPDQIELKG